MPNVYEARHKGREYCCDTEGSDHYKEGGLEPLDLMIAKGLAEDFCIGNMSKYAFRFKKTRNLVDLKKVSDYAHILCGIELSKAVTNTTTEEKNMETKEELLLKAIFKAAEDEPDDDYPETIADKVGYAEHVLTHNLSSVGRALNRLSRLSRLLLVSEKHEDGLPDIITNNELRMALEPMLGLRRDVEEITDMLLEIYHATKEEKK